MLEHYPEFLEQTQTMRKTKMKERQAPLYAKYQEAPETAVIRDAARTSCKKVGPSAPIYTEINFGVGNPISMPVGVHEAVGGESDYPNPGDILCGAIASCLDTTIRIVANRVGVKLKELNVEVTGSVDVRGTLRADKDVPVPFQSFDIAVTIEPAGFVPGIMLDKLLKGAEQCCVVLQTLRNNPSIAMSRKKS